MGLTCFILVVLLPEMFRFAQATCVPPGGCSVALAYYTFNSATEASLSNVASRFQASENDIRRYSGLDNSSAIRSGKALHIPFACQCEEDNLWHNFSYTVASGDTAINISTMKYGFLTNLPQMQAVNTRDLNSIYAFNILNIPVNCSCGDPAINSSYGLFLTYIAQENDTAESLSRKFNVTADLLQRYNQDVNLNQLQESVSMLFVPSQDGKGVFPPFNSTGLGNKGNSAAIVGGSIGGVVFIIALVGACLFYVYVYRRKKHREDIDTIKSHAAPQRGGTPSPGPFTTVSAFSNPMTSSGLSNFSPDRSVVFSYKELSDATDNFSNAKKIGQGGYGSVYYGVLHGQKLAIKRMNMQATKEFQAELQVLTRVHHTNLVHLVGYCTYESLFLVYEFVENGTLSQHLKYSGRQGFAPLSWEARIQVALDAARGLEYMHEHTTPTYIHRDIKSSNILLDNNDRAKVADFGLTKLTESGVSSSTIQSRLVGTFGYMAPEYARFGDISSKSDVYSFGVVLFEIISAKDAIVQYSDQVAASEGGRASSQGLVSFFEGALNDSVNGKERLRSLVDPTLGYAYPLESVWKMATLAGACTREEPLLRPNMRVVVVALMTLSNATQEWETDHSLEDILHAR